MGNIPIWWFLPQSPNGCVNPRFHMAITIWKRGTVSLSSLYGNGDYHMEMVISKGCVNPITIWKRGAVSFSSLWRRGYPYGNGDFQGMCKSPFPYGDRHIETGSRFIQLPIWKQGFPYGNGDSRFHMVIHVQKREAVVLDSLNGNGIPSFYMVIPISSQFLYGDPHFHVVIPLWKLTMHEMDM